MNEIEYNKEFSPEERLKYLKGKRAWLNKDGYELRKNRLIEMLNLMEMLSNKNVEGDGDRIQ